MSSDDEDGPLLLRLTSAIIPPIDDAALESLEARFEPAVAGLLGCNRERIAWVDGTMTNGQAPGRLRVDFCLYGDDCKGGGPTCAQLAEELRRQLATGVERERPLAPFVGATLQVVDDDKEEEAEIEESEALAMLDRQAGSAPLDVVRRLFLDERLNELRRLVEEGEGESQQAGLEVLSAADVLALESEGFCTMHLDGAFAGGLSWADGGVEALRLSRLDGAEGGGGFASAGQKGHDASVRDDRTVFVSGVDGARTSEAPEALRHPVVKRGVELLRAVQRDIASILRLRYEASHPEIQLAVYDPAALPDDDNNGDSSVTGSRRGARYERHRDGYPSSGDDGEACEGGPMWRRVTAILYLNGENWAADQGGALRLFCPNGSSKDSLVEERSFDVLPAGGRLVVFMAGAVEHEVRPTYAPRVALTGWFS